MTDNQFMTASGIVVVWPQSSRAIRFSFIEALGTIFESVINWYKFRKTVGELSSLSDHVLSDVGLQRSEIRRATHSEINQTGHSHPNQESPGRVLDATEPIYPLPRYMI